MCGLLWRCGWRVSNRRGTCLTVFCDCVVLFSLGITQRGGTVLHYAARSGNKDVVNLLLDKGADMNAVTKVRVTYDDVSYRGSGIGVRVCCLGEMCLTLVCGCVALFSHAIL